MRSTTSDTENADAIDGITCNDAPTFRLMSAIDITVMELCTHVIACVQYYKIL